METKKESANMETEHVIICELCGEEISGLDASYFPDLSNWMHTDCKDHESLWRRIRALEARLDSIDGGDMK